MSLTVDLQFSPSSGWESALAAAGCEAGLLQSVFWGRLMPALGRGTPLYLRVRDGDAILALLLAIHTRDIPVGMNRAWRLLAALFGSGRIEFADGPVILDGARTDAALAALLDWLAHYARRERVRLIRVGGPAVTSSQGEALSAAFTARGYVAKPWATFLVDLLPDDDALLMSFDHAARKGIKKASREGVRVRRLTDWDDYRDAFLLPYLDWTRSEGNPEQALATARLVWDHPGHHDYYRYYLAEANDGTPLAVLGMYLFNGVATEITSGLSPVAIERKLPAQDLLHWEMFLEARRAGCHTFNLAGVAPQPASPKEENIRRFKKKWGGRLVGYDQYEWQHPALRLLRRIRQLAVPAAQQPAEQG